MLTCLVIGRLLRTFGDASFYANLSSIPRLPASLLFKAEAKRRKHISIHTMSQPEQQRIQFILTLTENQESRVTRGQLPELDLVRQDIARSEYAIRTARH